MTSHGHIRRNGNPVDEMALQVRVNLHTVHPPGRELFKEELHNVVMPPLSSVQCWGAVAEEVAQGAGRDGAEGTFRDHILLPSGQIVRTSQAVGSSPGRPGQHSPRHGIYCALPGDVLLLFSKELGQSTLALEILCPSHSLLEVPLPHKCLTSFLEFLAFPVFWKLHSCGNYPEQG